MSGEERVELSESCCGGGGWRGGVAWRTKAALCHSVPARRHFQRQAAISSFPLGDNKFTNISLLLTSGKGWKIKTNVAGTL